MTNALTAGERVLLLRLLDEHRKLAVSNFQQATDGSKNEGYWTDVLLETDSVISKVNRDAKPDGDS